MIKISKIGKYPIISLIILASIIFILGPVLFSVILAGIIVLPIYLAVQLLGDKD
tara:strand:- start:544 stop:705 length:162 start_codon:yes stop_codon:yes gene_type:complete